MVSVCNLTFQVIVPHVEHGAGLDIEFHRQSFPGVPASQEMAQTDSNRMEQFRSKIEQAACDLGMDPAVIAGNFTLLRSCLIYS